MKLLTKEIEERLPRLGEAGDDLVVQAKFFTPWSNWTWYAIEYDPDTRTFWGLVDGFEREYGSFALSELEQVTGPAGLKVERDRWFTPMPVKELE